MLNKKTVKDIDVVGKKVLVRVDFNVPVDPRSGAITDDTRIREAIPTIKYLLDNRARVILCSHFGRPKGREKEASLAPMAARLGQLLGQPVVMADDCVGPNVEKLVHDMKEGQVLMLENLRFHPEEEKNETSFAQSLARLAEVYVNDAFGTAHRAHASTVGVTRFLPAVAGFLMEREITIMGRALTTPERPFGVLIGGAKISDKIGVLENILEKVDLLLIGGGMGSTFLKSLGYDMGKSLVEDEKIGTAKHLMERAAARGVRLLLPSDVVVADKWDAEAESKVVPVNGVPAGWLVMDIGPGTVKTFEAELKRCKTVIWNGPVGVFEFPRFRQGTAAMAQVIAGLNATTIVGGGSTAEAVEELGLKSKITHVSTGGGASLMFLEGKPLPGVTALMDK